MSFCQDDYYYSTKDHIHYLVSVYCVWHALGHWSDESLHNNSVLEQTRNNCSILWQMVATLKIIQKWSSFDNNNLAMTWSCPLQTQSTIFLTNILKHDVLKIEILRHFWLLYFGLAGGKHDEHWTWNLCPAFTVWSTRKYYCIINFSFCICFDNRIKQQLILFMTINQ